MAERRPRLQQELDAKFITVSYDLVSEADVAMHQKKGPEPALCEVRPVDPVVGKWIDQRMRSDSTTMSST